MTIKISIPKPELTWVKMTNEEYRKMSKDVFGKVIRRWCERNGFVQHLKDGQTIPARLPYHRDENDDGRMEVAQDFLAMLEQQNKMDALRY